MEQRRTRPRQHGPSRGAPRAPLPPQATRRPATAERRPAPGRPRPAPVAGPARLPNPRLTGLGCGLFCMAAMLVLGLLDDLLFGASLTVYGVLSLPVSALTAVWVRGGDLLTAPVVVPIAFAVGLVAVADDGGGGFLGEVMGLVTALSTQAGWLYGGTLIAGAVVVVRRIRLIRRRRRA
ncbi:DUF6542 domain-containing protein [Streptomyces fuscichromogenes]|uniref:Membrane protein n=1 Tax=Streptomyces fuscichromogenes TaxID=1324013 RepID=A0A917XJV5_9ACTN|nr:DUF6542 domain-containing protein [Streptomyces fuscichromogenes]GGN33497.1 membrane protein [Streptomyces fuscichromogenes]